MTEIITRTIECTIQTITGRDYWSGTYDVSHINIKITVQVDFIRRSDGKMIFSRISPGACVPPYGKTPFDEKELSKVLDAIKDACEHPVDYWLSTRLIGTTMDQIRLSIDDSKKITPIWRELQKYNDSNESDDYDDDYYDDDTNDD